MTLRNKIREVLIPFLSETDPFWYQCLPNLITSRLPHYVFGMSLTVITYERYVCICRGLEKEELLSTNKRWLVYFLISIIPVFVFSGDLSSRIWFSDFYCLEAPNFSYALPLQLYFKLASYLIFDITPMCVSFMLIGKTIPVLLRVKKKYGRNFNLGL